jgi:hypothetical protein
LKVAGWRAKNLQPSTFNRQHGFMLTGVGKRTGTTQKIQRGMKSVLLAALVAPMLASAQTGIVPDNLQKVAPVAQGGQPTNNSVPTKPDEGRTVTGKIFFAETNALMDSSNAMVTLQSGVTFKMLGRLQQAKTQEERMAVFQSDEYQKAIANPRRYAVRLSEDRSFRLAGVDPGAYELDLQFIRQDSTAHSTSTIIFTAPQEIVVPKAAETTTNATLDLGTVKLKQLTLPAFQPVPK